MMHAKINFIPDFFLEYHKNIASLSRYFGHAQPNPLKMSVSTCEKIEVY